MGKQEHSSQPAETSPTKNISSTTLRHHHPNEQAPSASDVHHSVKQQQNTAQDIDSAHGSHFLSLAGHPACTPHISACRQHSFIKNTQHAKTHTSSISHSLNTSCLFGTMGRCASESPRENDNWLHKLSIHSPARTTQTRSDCWTAVHIQLYRRQSREIRRLAVTINICAMSLPMNAAAPKASVTHRLESISSPSTHSTNGTGKSGTDAALDSTHKLKQPIQNQCWGNITRLTSSIGATSRGLTGQCSRHGRTVQGQPETLQHDRTHIFLASG